MFDKSALLKGIEDNELKLYLAKGLDRAQAAYKKREPFFSDFSDPVKAVRLKSMAEGVFRELKITADGGYEDAERLMVGFFPDFYEEYSFPIKTVVIKYNEKYGKAPQHRDILGSVLGLGIEREKIGDIILKEGRALVFAEEAVTGYIAANLEKAGHTRVSCEITEDIGEFTEKRELKEIRGVLASERTDAVLGCVFNLSRGNATEAVKAGRVFVNWIQVESPSKKLCSGDIITLRGKGRVKLLEFAGKTKKDKLILKYVKY